jgi:leucyl aminopeptidase
VVDISVQVSRLVDVAADALVVNLFQDVKELAGATAEADTALGGAISRLVALGDFTGKLNQIAVCYPSSAASAGPTLAAPRVLLVGLGKPAEFTVDRARQVAASAARRARELGARTLATKLHGAGAGILTPRQAAQAIVEGTLLGLYRFDHLRRRPADDGNGPPPGTVERLVVVEPDAAHQADVEAGATRGRILAESQLLVRDLVTQPGNVLSPRALADRAREVAAEVGLRCEVLERPAMEELGMGALLGVARGSDEPPQFIILEHAPPGREESPPIVLCGKAVTFDSGGISIKPAEGMWAMKDDMAGGAAVLGALRALALLKAPRRAIGLIPATENMPSGRATRPGDVLRAMDGQTIEIISTDAEGRLILADALAYGHRYQPAAMIDIATLTGGAMIALGHAAAAVMGNAASVIAGLQAAAHVTGEKVWELPLWDDDYKRLIRSDIADMKNSGGRYASAIGGGMLLKQFAKQVPWAHVDIAGVSWSDADAPYRPKGATGFGVRLLTAFVESYGETEAPAP